MRHKFFYHATPIHNFKCKFPNDINLMSFEAIARFDAPMES